MKVGFHPEADALYIELATGGVDSIEEIKPGSILDLR